MKADIAPLRNGTGIVDSTQYRDSGASNYVYDVDAANGQDVFLTVSFVFSICIATLGG